MHESLNDYSVWEIRRLGEFDGQTIATLKHIMHVAEEMGIPRSVTPLLLLLTILCYLVSMHAIETALR
jgi:hypothetical protein